MNVIFLQRRLINAPIDDADVAFTSIDSKGTPGFLNKLVIESLGYSLLDLPNKKDLEKGFSILEKAGRKPIIFITTVSDRDTADNLYNNLKSALEYYSKKLLHKRLWVPLMGTGSGGLSLEESYDAIKKAIVASRNPAGQKATYLFSFPNTTEAKELLKKLNAQAAANKAHEIEVPGKEPKEAIKREYFLAEWRFNQVDKRNEFFYESFWEKDNSDNYLDALLHAKPNDVIFLKTTYEDEKTNYLVIGGIGKITNNLGDGKYLDVEWGVRDINIEINDLGIYRRAFTRIKEVDLKAVLSKISQNKRAANYLNIEHYDSSIITNNPELTEILGDKIQNERLEELEAAFAQLKLNGSKIAQIHSDNETGTDYLDITQDVNAFAKILASKNFTPPIAIALFGDWGTGKSFFMNKLKERVVELSASNSTSYCSGVVHIHFNAWSYLDANLWASVVSKIFEKLNEYITGDSAAGEVKKEIENELIDKLSISREQKDALEREKQENLSKLSELETKRKRLNSDLEEKIAEIEKHSLKAIVTKVNEAFKPAEKIARALKENTSLSNTLRSVGIDENTTLDPVLVYKTVRSKYVFLREFLFGDKVRNNLLVLSLIIIGVIGIPHIINLFTSILSTFNFVLPQFLIAGITVLVAIARRVKHTCDKLYPLINAFWKIKVDYELALQAAESEFKQKEKAIFLQIENERQQIELLEINIQEVEKSINVIEFKINNSLSTEALYAFIDRRNNSDDYKKHLGIVSFIRKDFEILSKLFIDHTEESRILQFRKKLEKPLERIILYIDDLDRCPEEQVIEVLEAVNLLMAFPLFVVVVGVDPRWIKNALVKKYHLQFTGRDNNNFQVPDVIKINASNYLEKIFQVPFHLKPASDKSIKEMIFQLSKPNIGNGKPSTETSVETLVNNISNQEGFQESDLIINTEDKSVVVELKTPENAKLKPEPTENYLELSESEIELLQELSEIIGKNPRAVKRFINVYKIVKAHENLTSVISTNAVKDHLLLMFLLAVPIGPYKNLTRYIYNFIERYDSHQTLNAFFEEYKKGIIEAVNGNITLADEIIDQFFEIHASIRKCKSGNLLLSCNPKESKQHLQFIRRFTFSEMI